MIGLCGKNCAGCPECDKRRADPRYAKVVAYLTANPWPNLPVRVNRCQYRGDPTGEMVACPTCSGSVKLKVFACEKNGRCTVGRKADGVALCDGGCEIAKGVGTPAPPVAGKRHLLMHVYPSANWNTWRRSLDQVMTRRELFTGRRRIAVVTGPGLTDWENVRDYVGGFGEVFPVANDTQLREVATWGPLWDGLLETAADGDVAFYCHAKGATRNVDPGNMTHRWASLLFSINLDWWPDIEALLRVHPIVGCFKKVGYGFGRSYGRFHYSGTFFWVRVGDFRRRRYAVRPPQVWFGTEAWPGLAYDAGEAGAFYRETPLSQTDLYCPHKWRTEHGPEYDRWIASRSLTGIGSSSNVTSSPSPRRSTVSPVGTIRDGKLVTTTTARAASVLSAT